MLLKEFVLILCILGTCYGSSCTNSTGMCGAPINIKWWSIPPYIYAHNGVMQGIFPELLQKMVEHCCGACQQIKYSSVADRNEAALLFNAGNGTDMSLPIYGTMLKKTSGDHDYLPIVESPGILYIVESQKDLDSTVSNALLSAIGRAWPVMCFIYLAAAVSGIIIWALDSYWNPDQFPSNFFKGSWDGFWWACVSMTTVGYGDRAPKSFTARIYAFAWVLVGLVVIAIFNATMTASLTSVSMTANEMFTGEQVVVMSYSAEKQYAQTKNVIIKDVVKVSSLRDTLSNKSNNIKGALVDAYVAGYHKEDLSTKKGFRVGDVIEHSVAYGLLWSRDKINDDNEARKKSKDMKRCFISFTSLFQNDVNEVVQKLSQTLELSPQSMAEERSMSLLSTTYSWYIQIVCVCCSIIILYLVVGFTRERLQKRKQAKLNAKLPTRNFEDSVPIPKERTLEELLQRQCKELECMMENEVKLFLNIWNAKKKQIQLGFSNYSAMAASPFNTPNKTIDDENDTAHIDTPSKKYDFSEN